MAIDWTDQTIDDEFTFQMLNPNTFKSWGYLDGVILDKSSISSSYYSDTRTSAKLTVAGLGYKKGAAIRIRHKRGSFSQVVGTYVVTDDPIEMSGGEPVQTLTLHSYLYGMDQWKLTGWYSISKNAKVRSAFISACDKYGISYAFSANKSSVFKSAKSYEGGCSFLKMFNDMASRCGGRVEADPSGAVAIETYTKPSGRKALYAIKANTSDGIVQDGVSVSSNHLDVPTNIVVKYQVNSNSKWTSGSVDSDYSKKSARGYKVTKILNADSYDAARSKIATAQKHYKDIRQEWSLKTMYLPIWEGDCVNLYVSGFGDDYDGKRKCFVKTMDWDLGTMELTLTLKECATSYDEESDYTG